MMNTRSHSESLMGLMLVATSLSFLLQPTNVRFAGVATSIVLIGVCVCAGFLISVRKIEARAFLFWAICAALLVAHDMQDDGNSVATTKALAFLILLMFAVVCPALRVSEQWVIRIWQSIAFVCGCLASIALLRYWSGYEELNPDSLTGELAVKDRYSYVGISYLPATRNSDAFYFGIGSLACMWATLHQPRLRIIFGPLLVICGIALVGSLSRGAWIATLTAVAVAYSPPIWCYVLLSSGVFAILVLDTSALPMLNLVKIGLVSLINPNVANEAVHGFYTYSNESRLLLYSDAIVDVFTHPLGIGFSGNSTFTDFSAAGVTHSENMFLDIVLGVGWLGILVPLALLVSLRTAAKLPFREKSLSLAILMFVGVFCLFNGGVDFAFLWFCVGVVLLTLAVQVTSLTANEEHNNTVRI